MAGWNDFLGKTTPSGSQTAMPVGVQQQTTQGVPEEDQAPLAFGNGGAWGQHLNTYQKGNHGPDGMTGGRWGDVANGWNSPFYQKMFQQRQEREEAGTLGSWYDDQKFTGIATYDYKGQRNVRFGDIYQDGIKQGNIFDRDSGYDETSAYSALAQLTLDKKTQAKVYKDALKDKGALKRAVEEQRQQTTKEVDAWKSQQEYAKDVQEQKDDWDDTAEGFAAFGAGAVGGAAMGTAFGLPGAVVGGVVGGFSALLNKDALVDQAARASVQTRMADEEFGTLGAISTGLRQWGGAAMSAITPAQNLVQGITDSAAGEIGDDRVEYYEMEKRPVWLTGLNIAASFGDAALQFASPIGQKMFMASMTSVVSGGVGQLATQGGATFDDRRGDFHAPENFKEGATGVGAVAMDAVQLGLARGIMTAARGRGADALNGTQQIGGRVFTRENGEVTNVRNSISLLAPSEVVQWGSARIQAANMAARKGGAITTDEYNQMLYRAAVDLQNGTNLSKTAFVNAFGEGLEEGVQAVLEPISHGWDPDMGQVYESFLMGAAAGAGMSVGARRGTPNQSDMLLVQANLNRQLAGMPLWEAEEWKALSKEQRHSEAAMSPVVDEAMKDLAKKTVADQVREQVTFQAGLERSIDATNTVRDQELRTLNPYREGTWTISSLQSTEIPNHVVQTSATGVLELLQANIDQIDDRLSRLDETDPKHLEYSKMKSTGEALILSLRGDVQLFEQGDDSARLRINEKLENAWNEGHSDLAKMASVILSRDPTNSPGSFQMLLPQVGAALRGETSNGILQVSHAILKAIDGDWDGDKMRERVVHFDFMRDTELYINMRLGMNFLGTGDGKVMIGERATEKEQIRLIAVEEYTNSPLKATGALALKEIETRLHSVLGRVPGKKALIDNLIIEIRNGNPEAKLNFMQALAATRSGDLADIGRTGITRKYKDPSGKTKTEVIVQPHSNMMFLIDNIIVNELQRYAESTAARRTKGDTPNRERVEPITQDAREHADRAAKDAATLGQTMQQETAGGDPFRGPQKLHYSVFRAPLFVTGQSNNMRLNELIAFYEQLSSGAQMSSREDIFAVDEVIKGALRRLTTMAKQVHQETNNPLRSAFFIGGAQVPYFQYAADGSLTEGSGMISAAEAALKESVKELRRRDKNLLDSDPELAAHYQSLDSMGPGDALAAIFDAVPALAIIGEAANNYGANLTFGQIKADYMNLSPDRREAYRERAKTDVRYYKEWKGTLPYDLEAVANYEISNYRVFTDALFESAGNELTLVLATGELHGRIAKRDSDKTDEFLASLADIQSSLRDLSSKLYADETKTQLLLQNRDGSTNYQAMARLLELEPGFARRLTQIIPTEIANIVFKPGKDGKMQIPRWFFDMLLMPPKEGVMHYFRNTLIAQLNAYRALENPRDADDRFVELILELGEDPVSLNQFQKLLYSSKDLNAFLREVNTKFATGAPFLAWHRDAAQFDSTRTRGGWAKQLPGAELRQAMGALRSSAKGLRKFASKEIEQDVIDSAMITRIKQGGPDGALMKNLQDRLDAAGRMLQGLGPAAMKLAPLAAALGFFGNATDKGKATKLHEHLAHQSARTNEFSQDTGYEQLVGSMTSYDADDAANNMPAFGRGDVRLMDSEGRPFEWQRLDAAKFVELWEDPLMRPMLRAIVFPTAFEIQDNGSLSQQHLSGTSLVALLNNDVYKQAWRAGSHDEVMRAASMLDALSEKHGGSFEIQRMVSETLIAYTSGVGRGLEEDELRAMEDEVFSIVVRAVIAASRVGSPELTREIEKNLENMRRDALMPPDPTLADEDMKVVRDVIEEIIVGQLPKHATKTDQEALANRRTAWKNLVNNEDLGRAVKRFTINWNKPQEVAEKKQELKRFIDEHPNFVEASGIAEVALLRATTKFDKDGVPVLTGNPEKNKDQDQKVWEAAVRGIVGAWMKEAVLTSSTRVQAAHLPKEFTAALINEVTGQLDRTSLGRAKYWDQSFRYLFDNLLNPDHPVMKAARELGEIVNGTVEVTGGGKSQDLTVALRNWMDPKKFGRWTDDLARQSIDAMNRIDSSGVTRQVARAGISYARNAALSASTRRTFKDPAAAGIKPRVYQLNEDRVREILNDDVDLFEADGLTTPNQAPEPLVFLNGRFTDSIILHIKDAQGNDVSVDLFNRHLLKPGHKYQGHAKGRQGGYYVTSLEEIRASVEYALTLPQFRGGTVTGLDVSLFHPQDMPATPDYANNLFFEGTTTIGNGDIHPSLLASLWLSNGGLNRLLQAAALKANKKGTLALVNPELFTPDQVRALENIDDFYTMIHAKAQMLIGRDIGYGKLEPSYYNAVVKDLKLRHAVRLIVNGEPKIFSADEVIAMQKDGSWTALRQQTGAALEVGGTTVPEAAIPVELVTLSPRVLRTILGEQDIHGLKKPVTETPSIDSANVERYENSLQELVEKNVPGLLETNQTGTEFTHGKMEDTAMVRRSPMSQQVTKPMQDPKRLGAYERMLYRWNGMRENPDIARVKVNDRIRANRGKALDMVKSDQRYMSQFPKTALRTLGIEMDLAGNVIDPLTDTDLNNFAFAQMRETLDINANAAAHIYSHIMERNSGRRPDGILHGIQSLDWRNDKENQAYNILHGDLVVIRLETFNPDPEKALGELTAVLRKLADLGATVAFVNSNGKELRVEGGRVLETLGYSRIAGSGNLWAPEDPERRQQTLEAFQSRLLETGEYHTDNHVAVLQAPDLKIEESAAYVHNRGRKDGREVAVARDLLPSTAWPGFNTAATPAQIRAVREAMENIVADEARIDHLFQLGERVEQDDETRTDSKKTREEKRDELAAALRKALANFDDGTGLPRRRTEFAPGDIVGLIGPQGQIIFYRHGYEPPRKADLDVMLETPWPDGHRNGGVAIYGSDQMATATTHTGTIERWVDTAGYGLSVIESIPLQALGNKTVLERNGMKLIGIAMEGSGVELPDFGVLEGWEIDYIMHRADAISKENYDGVIDNARNAIAFLGADFAPAYYRTLFGKPWPTGNTAEAIEARKQARIKIRNVFEVVRRQERLSVPKVLELMDSVTGIASPELDAALGTVFADTDFTAAGALTNVTDFATAEQRITAAALLYMLVPGAKTAHIEAAGGFAAPTTGNNAATRMMPELFTRIFDRAPLGSDLRGYFFEELNRRIQPNPDTTKPNVGYVLREDWTFVVLNEDPDKNMETLLQFAEAHSSGDNPTTAQQARDRRDSQAVSRQQTLVAEQSLGSRLFMGKRLKKTQRFINQTGVTELNEFGDLFKLMNGGPVAKLGRRRAQQKSPMEQLALRMHRDAMLEYMQAVDTGDWSDTEKRDWDLLRQNLMLMLGAREEDKARVDSWVRMVLMRPKSANPENPAEEGKFSFRDATEALEHIKNNLEEGLLPTFGAPVPGFSFNDTDWLYKLSQNDKSTWKLKTGAAGRYAETWEDYVETALGVITADPSKKLGFDPAWQSAMDGFANSFMMAGKDYVSLPISFDEVKNGKLLDPATNEMVLSMNSHRAELISSRGVMDVYNASVEDLFGGNIVDGRYKGTYPETHAVSQARTRMRNWRRRNNMPEPEYRDYPDFQARGGRFVTNGTTTNSTMRILMNFRLATTMLDPMLRLAAPVDMALRNVLEGATQMLTGDGLGMGSQYDPRTRQHASDVIKMMANNSNSVGMLYDEMVTNPKLANAGRFERWTNSVARFAGRWQDPTYGMRPEMLMKRYVTAAMRYITEQGTATTVTPNNLLSMLDTDPLVLKKKHPLVHQYAINAAANVMMLKPTVGSLVVGKGLIDPLANNPKWIINVPSHLALKIPYTFSSFFFNVATNMLGLQALDAMAAVLLTRDPRKGGAPTLMGKWRAIASGDGLKNYDPAKHDIDWAGETLEAVNLSNAFIKSGLSLTSIFGLGLMGASLGLTGEDDEDRRRRRAAAMQGAGYVYDPRDPANDFRNADAIFFDNLPGIFDGLKEYFQVQGDESLPGGKTSMANLHWTVKQFLSPLMGIERFVHTGDFMQVVWGFEDALGSMPLVNIDAWDRANQSAAELHEAALDAEASGSPEALAESYGFLMNAMFQLERMLFENSFVNSIYMTMDKYDRDPYAMVDLELDGSIARDDTGVPMRKDIMDQVLKTEDDEYGNVAGETGLESKQRGAFNTILRTQSENKAVLALFGSLFTGFNGQDSLWRYDMAVKERKVDKNELSESDAEALIMSLWDPDKEREVLTDNGAEAVIRGVVLGTVQAGDPALQNVYLTLEQRNAIKEKLLDEMMQDYINLGHDQDTAENLAYEQWYGSKTNPFTTPLQKIVYDKEIIPYSPMLRYRQLNTTYIAGPDGRFVATGIGREKLNNFFGLAPLQRFNLAADSNMGVDGRLNSTDETANLNTGMRSLEKIDDSWANPTDEDIIKAMEEGVKDIVEAIRTASDDDGNGGYGRNWKNYGGGGYSRGGGGGGYGGGGSGFTYRLNSPTRNDPTYGRSDPYIRVDNPLIRRASIRRERFSSERGRLTQWQ